MSNAQHVARELLGRVSGAPATDAFAGSRAAYGTGPAQPAPQTHPDHRVAAGTGIAGS